MMDVKIEYNTNCKQVEYIDGEYFRKFVNNNQVYGVEYYNENSKQYEFVNKVESKLTEENILYLLINQKL